MIEPPRITQTDARLAAAIHLKVPRNEIRSVMGPAIGEVTAAARSQGVGPCGPWFTHHLKVDPATFDFQVCVPISAPIAAAGRVVCATMPAARVARTIYQGPYEKLGDAWSEFGGWIAANGYAAASDFYECYLEGPESSSNPADWRTELTRPLID
ncbi:MAG: GyrI-like domain-containing protein [Acidobacteria bacterium]|nr:GyrI-like domain-containing protein [Acidobacteriota bacterium]